MIDSNVLMVLVACAAVALAIAVFKYGSIYVFFNSSINKFNTEHGRMKNKLKNSNETSVSTASSDSTKLPALLKATSSRQNMPNGNASPKPKMMKQVSTTDTSESSVENSSCSFHLTSTDCSANESKSNQKEAERHQKLHQVKATEDRNISSSDTENKNTSSNESSQDAHKRRSVKTTTRRKKKTHRKKDSNGWIEQRRRRPRRRVCAACDKSEKLDNQETSNNFARRFLSWIEDGHHHSRICRHGGIIEFPFGTAHIPNGAVETEEHLRFIQPVCELQHENVSVVLVPPVYCSNLQRSGAVVFQKYIMFSLKVDMAERLELCTGAEAEVQITECAEAIKWITATSTHVPGTDERISFQISRFAGFRVITKYPAHLRTKLFYTLCVQRFPDYPNPSHHYLFVVIYCVRGCNKVKEFMDRKDVQELTQTRSLEIQAPCTLKCTVTPNTSEVEPGSTREFTIKSLKEPVWEYLCIQLSKKQNTPFTAESMLLNFNINLTDGSSQDHRCPFVWTSQQNSQPISQHANAIRSPSPPTQQPVPTITNINVYGGVGVRYETIMPQ